MAGDPTHTNGVGNGTSGTAKQWAPDEKFRKGAAISVWQNASDEGVSNWTRYTKMRWPFNWFGVSTTRGQYKIGKSSDFWERYRDDLMLAKQAGMNTFRFSFEWARIEPTRGQYDQSAIKRFHEILDVMDELGLEPSATLHHFTHPAWFEDLGGFRYEKNIPIFVEWCVAMFKIYGSRIKMWATFNEPSCFSFLSHITAMAPPGYLFNLIGSGYTLMHILKAHVAVYKALKVLPGGQEAQIGLVHHHITFKAQKAGVLSLFAERMAYWAQYWWAWDIVDHWMHTGEFVWKLPILGEWIRYKDPNGKPPCDWWGINYYSRAVLSWYLAPACMDKEVMTDMYYPIYPDGLYQAIKRSSAYGIPMYVTETGIADAKDDRRGLFIDTYFKEVLRALADGYDIRGFYYWTLVDNFEWATGFTMKFGLYAWEPDGSVDRKLKEGAKVLVRYYQTLPDNLHELKKVAQSAQKTLGADMSVEEDLDEQGIAYVAADQTFHKGHKQMDTKKAGPGVVALT